MNCNKMGKYLEISSKDRLKLKCIKSFKVGISLGVIILGISMLTNVLLINLK